MVLLRSTYSTVVMMNRIQISFSNVLRYVFMIMQLAEICLILPLKSKGWLHCSYVQMTLSYIVSVSHDVKI